MVKKAIILYVYLCCYFRCMYCTANRRFSYFGSQYNHNKN